MGTVPSSPSLYFTPAGELLEEITTEVVTSEAAETNTKSMGKKGRSCPGVTI